VEFFAPWLIVGEIKNLIKRSCDIVVEQSHRGSTFFTHKVDPWIDDAKNKKNEKTDETPKKHRMRGAR
jgi:hypothetical protein